MTASETRRLLEWFEGGRLVRPSPAVPNYVDLVHALFRLGGVEDLPASSAAAELAATIGRADHYVLILVDGLGMNLLDVLPKDGFLRSHFVRRLQSVFLSTTATALTTLATGRWPAVNGVPGWYAYLDEFDVSAVTLPFVERTTERPLAELGVRPESLFPVPSLWPRLRHEPLTLLPRDISDTVYSRYASGGTPRGGYREIADALAVVRDRVSSARHSTLTYVYLPQLDALSHVHGTTHPLVCELLPRLDTQLAALATDLAGRCRIVIAADHGQTDVPAARRIVLPEDDPLRLHLHCQPTGEPTVPVFHVRKGHGAAFSEEFTRRFGEVFALLSTEEVDRLRLLGPEGLSPQTGRRLGDFVGIAPQPAKFYIKPTSNSVDHVGVHGGLSSDEMWIPLVLI